MSQLPAMSEQLNYVVYEALEKKYLKLADDYSKLQQQKEAQREVLMQSFERKQKEMEEQMEREHKQEMDALRKEHENFNYEMHLQCKASQDAAQDALRKSRGKSTGLSHAVRSQGKKNEQLRGENSSLKKKLEQRERELVELRTKDGQIGKLEKEKEELFKKYMEDMKIVEEEVMKLQKKLREGEDLQNQKYANDLMDKDMKINELERELKKLKVAAEDLNKKAVSEGSPAPRNDTVSNSLVLELIKAKSQLETAQEILATQTALISSIIINNQNHETQIAQNPMSNEENDDWEWLSSLDKGEFYQRIEEEEEEKKSEIEG